MRDDVAECHTHTGPCVYDPLTWNIILASPALHCSMMRSGYWRQKVNYHWLDFIEVDLRNWGLSQSRDGMRRRRRRRNWRRCHHFTSLDILTQAFYFCWTGSCANETSMQLMQQFSKHVVRGKGRRTDDYPSSSSNGINALIEKIVNSNTNDNVRRHKCNKLDIVLSFRRLREVRSRREHDLRGKTRVAPSERCTLSQVADRSGLLWKANGF